METIPLLSKKKVIYAANLDEEGIVDPSASEYYNKVLAIAEAENSNVVPVCAEIEAQIVAMDPDDRELFMSEYGLESSGLERIVTAGYKLLGLISFLTGGPEEVRAWTIVDGTKAPQAAGKIHSDIERGFIRAEIIAFDDLMACGNMANAKAKGLVRSEGKEYVMKDGDVTYFLFNV